jgi:F-type H+-transporting ATPase subunit alpha
VVVLYAVNNGYFSDVDKDNIKKYEADMLLLIKRETKILQKIDDTGLITDEIKKELNEFLTEFKKEWKI